MKKWLSAVLLILLLLLCLTGTAYAKAKDAVLYPKKATLYVGADGTGDGYQLVLKKGTEEIKDNLVWKSSDDRIATVNENGFVSPLKTGNVVIWCFTPDGGRKTCKLTVKDRNPVEVHVKPEELSLLPGQTYTLTYELVPANAVNKSVVWKSSNKKIVSVTDKGVVTALSPGTAIITCKASNGGIVGKATVKVGLTDADIYYVAIGQGDYKSLNALPSCYDDAKRFSTTLKSCDFGQKSMTGAEFYDQTAEQLVQVLDAIPSMGMDEDDITFVFYSGHGQSAECQEYRGAWVGVDIKVKNYKDYIVTVDTIRTYLDKIPGTVVVILDSCMSGQFITAKGNVAVRNRPATQKELAETNAAVINAFRKPTKTDKGLESIVSNNPLASKYIIITSCGPLELSYALSHDMAAYSIFTRYLCEGAGITGADTGEFRVSNALPADKDKNKFVTVQEVYRYTAPKVRSKAKERNSEEQNIMVWPENSGFPIFARIKG